MSEEMYPITDEMIKAAEAAYMRTLEIDGDDPELIRSIVASVAPLIRAQMATEMCRKMSAALSGLPDA